MTDLQAKYQKLATEYSKLRAQVPVLKKAVLDEQAKHEELKETLKERDQTVRQYEQETDSLMFRNRQLSTRVSLLQEELDRSDVKHSKHKQDKRGGVPYTPELSAGDAVLGEELKSKIEENARLHRQVFESVEKHQQSENELLEKIRQLSDDVSRQKQLLIQTEQQYTEKVNKLQSQKTNMEIQLQQQEKQLKDAHFKVETLQTQLNSVTDIESSPSQTYNNISGQTTASSETPSQASIVDSPLSSQQRNEMITEITSLVANLCRHLANLYTYSRQRWAARTGGGQTLPDITTLKTADSLEESADMLKSCAGCITQLLPYQLQSIDAECRGSTCTKSLEASSRQLQMTLKNFSSSLSHLQTYICVTAAQSGSHGNQTTAGTDKLVAMLVQAGADFHKSTTDLSKQFNVKVSMERQQSTATQKWKQTDDHITFTLESLVTCSSLLAGCLKNNVSLRCNPQSDDGLGRHAMLGAVSSADILENGQAVITSTLTTDNLASQVATLQERLCHLEQDKEKWMLEIELQQMKYEKLLQKAAYLEESLQNRESSSEVSATAVPTSPLPIATNEASKGRLTVNTSLIRKQEMDSCEEDSETREELIKQYFGRRLAEVTSSLQTADSKALHLHTECCALHRRLRQTHQDRENLQEELAVAKDLVAQVKDELQTMTDGYKSQLSTMSEHLAGMNEKLTAQKDEIDMLKYQLHTLTTSKKGRGK